MGDERIKVRFNGECLYINGRYVVDCNESLDYTFECIAGALGIEYEYEEE